MDLVGGPTLQNHRKLTRPILLVFQNSRGKGSLFKISKSGYLWSHLLSSCYLKIISRQLSSIVTCKLLSLFNFFFVLSSTYLLYIWLPSYMPTALSNVVMVGTWNMDKLPYKCGKIILMRIISGCTLVLVLIPPKKARWYKTQYYDLNFLAVDTND